MLEIFINEIINNQEVFILEDQNGIAFSQSILFTSDNKQPVPVICFWSNVTNAKKASINDWDNFKTFSICLSTFIEDYLVQIYNDSLIVGINFDSEMIGLEIDPLDLILEILKKCKDKKINLDLEYFKNINDLENQVKQLMKN